MFANEVDGVPVPCDMGDVDWDTNRLVAVRTVGAVTVSTVFSPINMALSDGPELWYETMSFPGAEVQRRYATREQALVGHDLACEEMAR